MRVPENGNVKMKPEEIIQTLRDEAGEIDEEHRNDGRQTEHPMARLLRSAAQIISDQQDYIDNLERGVAKLHTAK